MKQKIQDALITACIAVLIVSLPTLAAMIGLKVTEASR
jgi:hypothetical protein